MDSYLMLAAAEGCGPGLVAALLDPSLEPEAALRAPPELPFAVRRRLGDPALARVAAAWRERAQQVGLVVWTAKCAGYPERLRSAPLRPLVLFARGDAAALAAERRAVAIVGTRTPTPYGLAAAADFAGALARAGFVLWSGLAVGIDARVHRAALAHGTPTVAVLAGGLDRIYPAEHKALADRIAQHGGLLLAEAPPGLRATRGHFPRRNRIMAHATDAVVVVEAGLASGSLHTARFAADCGVPVFAVPGPYTSPRSVGCHALIADGAQVARDPEDLLRRLGVEAALRQAAGNAELELSADETAILAVLERGPRPSDLVQREARLPGPRYLEALFSLTASGLVEPLPGDVVALSRRTGPADPT